MPRVSQLRIRNAKKSFKRFREYVSIENFSHTEPNVTPNELVNLINVVNKFTVSTQTDFDETLFVDKMCQTDFEEIKPVIKTHQKTKRLSVMQNLINVDMLCSLVDVLKGCSSSWGSIQDRSFGAIIYMLLRLLNVNYANVSKCMESIGCVGIYTAHSWVSTMIEADDPLVILRDERGGYKKAELYELYPEIEQRAKLFAINMASEKHSLFCVKSLAKYITNEFENSISVKLGENELIRSESSCKLDLLRWGAKWESNKKRPYFEGHEREDVVEARKKFVTKLIKDKQLYYQQSRDDSCQWISPADDPPHILICHDESTFKSGEIQTKRWLFPDHAPFFKKGTGRSLMLSYFLVQHKYLDLFVLDEAEWNEAVLENPSLTNESLVEYEPRSANAFIQPGKDNYFNNEIIIEQFERLFTLLKYKKIFNNHVIDVLVDNARTHTAKKYDVSLLGKKEGTNCPYEKIEWEENGQIKSIDCFYDKNNQNSKGLFILLKELNLIDSESDSKSFKLNDLRQIMLKHPAFVDSSLLETVGKKYCINVLFLPKFHCELSPIEGLWCFMKQYVRKRTDKNFETMKDLIQESKIEFMRQNVNFKLWRRFWKCLELYDAGLSYKDVLNQLFGKQTKDTIISHRKIQSII